VHTRTEREFDITSARSIQSPHLPIPDPSLPLPRHNVPNGSVVPTRQEAVLIGGDTVLLLKEIVELRERDVAKRIYINNGLRDLKYKSRHEAKAQEEFMRASGAHMAAVTARTADKTVVLRLQQAWTKLVELTSVAQSREKQLEDAQKDLLSLENRLFMKEGEFYEKVRGLTREALASDAAPTDDFTTLSTSSASSVSTVSVAHKYYSKVGDINLMRERIFNFDSEHRRDRMIRDVQRKEGQRLDPPNRVFLLNYFAQREAMIRTYLSAKDNMEELRQSCDRQGVKVQPPDLPPVLDHSQRFVENPLHHYSEQPAKENFHHHLSNLYGHTDNQHRIVQWIRAVRRNSYVEPIESSVKDSASPPLRAAEIRAWANQPVEDYPALSSYNRGQPSSTSDFSSTETDTPERIERKRLGASRQDPNSFRGEPPSRRYSLPFMPLISAPVTRLSNGALEWKRKGEHAVPCECCAMDECSKSLDLPRSSNQF
jgi:hypothetical protein